MSISIRLKTKRMALGCIAALVVFPLCFYFSGSVAKSLIFALLFPATATVRLEVKGVFATLCAIGSIALTGAAALFLSQFCQGQGFSSLMEGRLLFGWVCCMILSCLLFLIFPNIRFHVSLTAGLVLILSTANYFVYQFRGSELSPIDFFSIGTALNVAGGYTFSVTPTLVYSWILYFLIVFAVFSIRAPKFKRLSVSGFTVSVLGVVLFCTFLSGSRTFPPHHFRCNGTVYNGYVLNFVVSLRECFLQKPDGYSQESVDSIQSPYLSKTDATLPDSLPNIIVIMNESFADLNVLGDHLQTSQEVAPFIQSLRENTIHGYALTSAFGGRTANSEYEFLAGATMAFAPQGSIAYQQYVSEHSYSMVSGLKDLGYTTVAMHPYIASGWMRNTVWPLLGFERSMFLEDYPQTDLLREYVSDEEMVSQVITQYTQRDADKPLFLFGVTMQNHSPFNYAGSNYTETVQLTGNTAEYPDANQYLSLLQASDRAMETLITYFAQVEEDTVIVFYGDHLPALESSFYESIHGGPFATLDEQMLQYKIPFFIWANYDIPEETVECTSLNYLSNLVADAAGIPLSPYQLFLKDLQEVIPAININGFYSRTQGCYLPISEATGEEKEWLNRYQQLQYAYMTGKGSPAFYKILPSTEKME